ncbi:sodium-dependent phosphate transporter 2-like [Glandiceps talaboti]
MDAVMSEYMWMVIVGFIIAFLLAFAIGANDVANSFATSVGAKVLTLRGACILATIFETSGAVFLGAKVSSTIRDGIFNVTLYEGREEVLMLGEVSALTGSLVWLSVATFLKLPVSTTHSIVGAMVGFHLVVFGTEGLNWRQLLLIVLSWFTSPALSGVISCVIFVIIRWSILNKDDVTKPGLISLPIFYALTIAVNSFSIFYDGPAIFGFDKIPLYGTFILSFGAGIVVAILVQIFVVPWMRRKIARECNGYQNIDTDNQDETLGLTSSEKSETSTDNKQYGTVSSGDQQISGNAVLSTNEQKHKQPISDSNIKDSDEIEQSYEDDKKTDGPENEDQPKEGEQEDTKKDRGETHDRPEAAILFRFLQILTACFGAFAHGGNDVSNAIGPVTALWFIYRDGTVSQEVATPIWLLFYGGVGISIGLWIWGWRVIKTVGEDLTVVTPSSGFTIEFGSATTVLLASNLGVPISSTHCKIGSVVSVGRVREQKSVNWRLFGGIIIAWCVTVPAAGAVSAGVMALLQNAL